SLSAHALQDVSLGETAHGVGSKLTKTTKPTKTLCELRDLCELGADAVARGVLLLKIGLVSLGCPKNLVDGEVMLGLAQQAGHEITADARDADVIIVNTCAFIDNAKQESIDAILEMAQHTREGKRLVVTGCLAERYRDELKKEIPEIDAVLGTGELADIDGTIEGDR